ncbi:MAG: enoyl-CoA hydratase/isomerase family protein [Candidatus Promineifilaceae bacterium]|nr:enoyl-CoA hydratase/isomerase family protein [Candidatus Promineifilaceae bacterium]
MENGIAYHVEDGIGVLRIERPRARNALDWAAQEQFAATVDAAARDESLRALIITASGPAFVSGGDLKELAQHADRASGERLNRVMGSALAQLIDLPLPVLAAVNGDAAGGGWEIITACDLRLMAAHAHLRFAQVRVGLTTGWGGAGRLVRLVGRSRALELLLSGRDIAADEAQRIGLVHRVVPAGEGVLTAAQAWAESLKALPRGALAAMKRLVYAAGDDAAVNEYERELFLNLWASPNHREALAAFLEKRPPRFNQGDV